MNTTPLPPINPARELEKSIEFIRTLLKRTQHEKIIIAVSGGIDSATSLNLLFKSIDVSQILVAHFPYYETSEKMFYETIVPLAIPPENILLSPIKEAVDVIAGSVEIIKEGSLGCARDDKEDGSSACRQAGSPQTQDDRIRLGNIMARVRMIYLFDLAKKHQALVCGTENRSEYHLGYFTRFGDAASDFEIINHLYKTQVYQLAKYLQVPDSILNSPPSANLWDGQTDEGEMGFSYEEADPVLYLHFEQGKSSSEIESLGYKNAQNILDSAAKNAFKHEVPYVRG
ncbi:NAD(+) synthase [Candidatus Woesebacteria bacterium]|nr:NAD(+) synthase [Candidatus Woesebacteria bacterium]